MQRVCECTTTTITNTRLCGIDSPPLLAAEIREDDQVLVTELLAIMILQLQDYSSNDKLY